jgi:hypothetical protein
MGGKLMNFYSEDLTNLLLEDILVEVCADLQSIEEMEKSKVVVKENQNFAKDLLREINQYEQDA